MVALLRRTHTIFFNKAVEHISPIDREVRRSALQFVGIKTRLQKDFAVARSARIGSHTKGTAIRRISDLDMMVVLRKSAVEWGDRWISSKTLLGKIRDSLSGRYTSTEIRRDGQAIAVRFGGGEHAVDVVPAVYESPGGATGHPVYRIPDGSGEWLFTSPDYQLKLLRDADSVAGGKLVKVLQLLKWWLFSRSEWIPLDSMYLETALVLSKIVHRENTLSRNLGNAFVYLAGLNGSDLPDPTGLGGVFLPSWTEAQFTKVMNALVYAAEHALKALEAETLGEFDESIRQWQIVYNRNLPDWR